MTDGFHRARLDGYCRVTDSNGNGWMLPRSEFPKVRMAWLKGAQFVDTVGFHGYAMTIRLKYVDGISDVSAEQYAAIRAEEKADAADDTLAGGAV